ncbi:MAG: PAS domain S-box protein [Paludibacter sp.]|nr:PAS domain S-box protein [Paludibacter sp.]
MFVAYSGIIYFILTSLLVLLAVTVLIVKHKYSWNKLIIFSPVGISTYPVIAFTVLFPAIFSVFYLVGGLADYGIFTAWIIIIIDVVLFLFWFLYNFRQLAVKFRYADQLNSTLIEISQSTKNSKVDDLDNNINANLGLIGRFLDYRRVYIYIKDDKNKLYHLEYQWSNPDDDTNTTNALNNNVSYEAFDERGGKCDDGQIVEFVVQNSADSLNLPFSNIPVKSFVLIPLLQAGQCLGFIGFDTYVKKQRIQKSELETLNAYSGIISSTIYSKKSEKEFSRSKTLFDDIVNTIPDLVWLKDKNGFYITCNKAFENFFDVRLSEIVGKSDYDFLDQDYADFFRLRDRIAMENNQPTVNEEWVESKNGGHKIYLETIKTPMYDAAGNLIGVLGIGRDITERHRIRKLLQESNLRLERAELASNSGNWEIYVGSGKVIASKGACRIYGIKDTENTYEMIKNIPLPEYRMLLDEQLESTMRDGTVYDVKFKIKTFDTKEIKDIHSTAFYDPDKKVLYGIITDITREEATQKLLREQDERFKNIFQRSIVGMSLTTIDGNLSVNEAFVKMLGYKKSEIENINWRQITYPEDIEYNEIVVKDILNGKKDSERWIKRYFHKNGNIVWVDLSTTVHRDENNKPLYFITILVDITKQKNFENQLRESEGKLRAMFSSMTEMVVMHEMIYDDGGNAVDYRIIDCNESFTKITGIKYEQAVGKLATEVYQSEKAPYIDIYTEVVKTQRPREYTAYYEPMDKHFIISIVSPSENHFATITTDISEIKTYEEQLKSKNSELERYLYVASHDLRSPLVNIQGFSLRLEKQLETISELYSKNKSVFESNKELFEFPEIITTKIPKTLHFIQSNVIKMDNLISSLLQISRTGRVELHIANVNVEKLLHTIITTKNYQISELNASVVFGKIADCYGDEQQLNQLFSNIIDNALKYKHPERIPEICISSTCTINKVVYCIQDNGIGISERNINKIWDVFYRVNPMNNIQGDGIGLSLAQRIVSKHKGKIWVESQLEVGSKFYIELNRSSFEPN